VCTLTWTHAGGSKNPGTPGSTYKLWFNRDELRSRGAEIAPREDVTPSGVRYLAPSDSDAGGTWLAVNEFGVTIALLNGYRESKGPARDEWTSRGLLVRSLADLRGTDAAWSRLSPRALAPFRPAIVVITSPSAPTLVARWDGRDVVIDPLGERQLPLTSSSYEQDAVRASRQALYRESVSDMTPDGARPTPELLAAFQSHVSADGPTPFTPSMAREDAATRSQCFVEVEAETIRLSYAPGAPHDTEYESVLSLARGR